MRQIILDTETTGLDPREGHRIIEIGCIELVNRRPSGRVFHRYLNPDRGIDAGAVAVHGLSAERLAAEPRFAEIADEFVEFVRDAEVIAHNAVFDTAFIDAELQRLGHAAGRLDAVATIVDSLAIARRLHPGQRNSLDALCRRYGVDNSHRDLHGALLDARLLADVYLQMTGGQSALGLAEGDSTTGGEATPVRAVRDPRLVVPVIRASADELAAHERLLDRLAKKSGGDVPFRQLAG